MYAYWNVSVDCCTNLWVECLPQLMPTCKVKEKWHIFRGMCMRNISQGFQSVTRYSTLSIYRGHISLTISHKTLHCSRARSMMTSSNGNIFRVTGPLCGEFTGPGEFPTQRPVMRSFDVFFDLRLNKRLSKQAWGWWFETLSWSLWRHCNAGASFVSAMSGWSCIIMLFCVYYRVIDARDLPRVYSMYICDILNEIKTESMYSYNTVC